jgi:octaprenyl-diphosphate synthase
LGDYLFTHAFHLAASLESADACRWIGQATNKVCEGEMQQVHERGNLDLDENAYFAVIEGKTAALTAVSCRLGAAYAGAAESTVAACERYGRHLGIAFQIADDVLDIWGEERITGKSLGTDLQKQKLTLPVIHLLRLVTPETALAIRRLLSEGKADHRRLLRPYLQESGALDYSWQRAKQHVKLALDALESLVDSDAKSVLRTLAQFVVRRAS